MDLLGRPLRRRGHRRLLPPVHPPGRRHEGPRLLPEQRVSRLSSLLPVTCELAKGCVLKQWRSTLGENKMKVLPLVVLFQQLRA